MCEILGSHGGEYEDERLLWCNRMMEAVLTSESSVFYIETTQHYILEGSHLQILC
jgi:hypothetical protein